MMVAMSSSTDLPVIAFPTSDAWDWLAEQHATSAGLWLKIAKMGSGVDTVSYQQALDIALCYGWIDGQKASFDDTYWLQKFTPRRPRSKWSKVNRGKVAALIEQGRMRAAGRREVDQAKADGRWDAAYGRIADFVAMLAPAPLPARPAPAGCPAAVETCARYSEPRSPQPEVHNDPAPTGAGSLLYEIGWVSALALGRNAAQQGTYF